MTVSAGISGMSRLWAVVSSSRFAPCRAAKLSNQAIGSIPPSGSSSFLLVASPRLGGGAIASSLSAVTHKHLSAKSALRGETVLNIPAEHHSSNAHRLTLPGFTFTHPGRLPFEAKGRAVGFSVSIHQICGLRNPVETKVIFRGVISGCWCLFREFTQIHFGEMFRHSVTRIRLISRYGSGSFVRECRQPIGRFPGWLGRCAVQIAEVQVIQ